MQPGIWPKLQYIAAIEKMNKLLNLRMLESKILLDATCEGQARFFQFLLLQYAKGKLVSCQYVSYLVYFAYLV